MLGQPCGRLNKIKSARRFDFTWKRCNRYLITSKHKTSGSTLINIGSCLMGKLNTSSKNDTLTKCRFIVGPTSATLAQQKYNIELQSEVYWDWPGCFRTDAGLHSSVLKHKTTLFSLSDHEILSHEWRVIVDQVQVNYYSRSHVL